MKFRNLFFRSILTFLAILVTLFAFSQKNKSVIFRDGDKVCFVGNSITHSGEFHHNILLYYATHFPKQKVTFFNSGISGDVTNGILNRIQDDILSNSPNYAVIMIGMNDVLQKLYSTNPTYDIDTLQKRKDALNIYKKNLDSIVVILMSKGVKVILQKPSIYDQTAILPKPINLGVNDALKICADYMETLAEKYNLSIVDYWTIMNSINQKMQLTQPSFTIVGSDRIHPGPLGNLVMAYQFIKNTGAQNVVSNIVVSNKSKDIKKLSKNCSINIIHFTKDRVLFRCKEEALPFPVLGNQSSAIELVPFTKEMNTEMLVVKGINTGYYRLQIDTFLVGVFSAQQLQEGINLSNFTNTPQFQQALKVRNALTDLWKIEDDLRTIKFVEHMYLKKYGFFENLSSVKAYLDSLYNQKYQNNSSIKVRFSKYPTLKIKEDTIKLEADKLRELVYSVNQTKEHLFDIQKIN